MKTSLTLLSLSALLVTTSSAFAQSAAAPPGSDPQQVTAAPVGSAPEVGNDPNIDRGFILPTAMNQPAGSLTYNNYELLLHGFTYGITDRVQATATVLSPIVKEMPFFGIAALKGQIVALPRFYLALQGTFGYGHTINSSSTGGGGGLVGGGAFATACLREDCSSIATASATYQLAFATGSSGTGQMIVYGGSLVHRVSPHVKLLGEVTTAAAKDPGQDFDHAPGALVSYGVRFHTANIASDVGFMKPFFDDGDDPFLMGLPFINVSYRWQ
jgi:hypothetical protein